MVHTEREQGTKKGHYGKSSPTSGTSSQSGIFSTGSKGGHHKGRGREGAASSSGSTVTSQGQHLRFQTTDDDNFDIRTKSTERKQGQGDRAQEPRKERESRPLPFLTTANTLPPSKTNKNNNKSMSVSRNGSSTPLSSDSKEKQDQDRNRLDLRSPQQRRHHSQFSQEEVSPLSTPHKHNHPLSSQSSLTLSPRRPKVKGTPIKTPTLRLPSSEPSSPPLLPISPSTRARKPPQLFITSKAKHTSNSSKKWRPPATKRVESMESIPDTPDSLDDYEQLDYKSKMRIGDPVQARRKILEKQNSVQSRRTSSSQNVRDRGGEASSKEGCKNQAKTISSTNGRGSEHADIRNPLNADSGSDLEDEYPFKAQPLGLTTVSLSSSINSSSPTSSTSVLKTYPGNLEKDAQSAAFDDNRPPRLLLSKEREPKRSELSPNRLKTKNSLEPSRTAVKDEIESFTSDEDEDFQTSRSRSGRASISSSHPPSLSDTSSSKSKKLQLRDQERDTVRERNRDKAVRDISRHRDRDMDVDMRKKENRVRDKTDPPLLSTKITGATVESWDIHGHLFASKPKATIAANESKARSAEDKGRKKSLGAVTESRSARDNENEDRQRRAKFKKQAQEIRRAEDKRINQFLNMSRPVSTNTSSECKETFSKRSHSSRDDTSSGKRRSPSPETNFDFCRSSIGTKEDKEELRYIGRKDPIDRSPKRPVKAVGDFASASRSGTPPPSSPPPQMGTPSKRPSRTESDNEEAAGKEMIPTEETPKSAKAFKLPSPTRKRLRTDTIRPAADYMFLSEDDELERIDLEETKDVCPYCAESLPKEKSKRLETAYRKILGDRKIKQEQQLELLQQRRQERLGLDLTGRALRDALPQSTPFDPAFREVILIDEGGGGGRGGTPRIDKNGHSRPRPRRLERLKIKDQERDSDMAGTSNNPGSSSSPSRHPVISLISPTSPTDDQRPHRVSLLERFEFCRIHHAEAEIVPAGLAQDYPLHIQFSELPQRVMRMAPELRGIIHRTVPSLFVERALERYKSMGTVNARRPGVFLAHVEHTMPGYYGSKGAAELSKILVRLFLEDSNTLTHELAHPQLPIEYIQQVLVPEAGMRLIREDRMDVLRQNLSHRQTEIQSQSQSLSQSQSRGGGGLDHVEEEMNVEVTLEEARQIMLESVEFGNYIHDAEQP